MDAPGAFDNGMQVKLRRRQDRAGTTADTFLQCRDRPSEAPRGFLVPWFPAPWLPGSNVSEGEPQVSSRWRRRGAEAADRGGRMIPAVHPSRVGSSILAQRLRAGRLGGP